VIHAFFAKILETFEFFVSWW